MSKKFVFIFLLVGTMLGIFIVKDLQSVPTITYFPIDYGTSFKTASTNLSLVPGQNNYKVSWKVSSKSDIPMYLRQDVSLLYANGELKGMRSKWLENTDTIQFAAELSYNREAIWQSISFHYGEIHSDNTIGSIQKLSNDELAVYKEKSGFQSSKITTQSNQIKDLEKEMKKRLVAHWQDLMTYFEINSNDYYSIPLTSLYHYQKKPFPHFNQKDTNRIMGQLWEGLYKNYVLPNINSQEELVGYVPLILIAKDGDHLLVIYEMNGKKEKLIQKLENK